MGWANFFVSYQGIQTAICSLGFRSDSLLLTLSTYTTRLFVLFWNTAAKCGIMPYRAICRTNWKKCKKRAMRIIFTGHSYDEALQLTNCTRLSDRRNKMCIKTLKKIVKRAGPLAENVTESRACVHQYQIRNLFKSFVFIQVQHWTFQKQLFSKSNCGTEHYELGKKPYCRDLFLNNLLHHHDIFL